MQGYPDGEDKLDAGKLAIGCLIWLGGAAAATAIIGRCFTYDPGVGTSPELARTPHSQVDSSAAIPSVSSERADAGLSQPDARETAGIAATTQPLGNQPQARYRGGLPAMGDLADYELDPGAEPTWQGLYAMTVEQWSDPEFLHDAYALPTAGDCQIALTDDAVELALADVCAYDLVLVELGSIPTVRRSAKTRALLDAALRERANSMAALMQRLDEVSGYKSWSVMDKLYGEWAR